MRQVYGPAGYLLILALMVAMGFLFRWFPISAEVHGVLHITIGSALIHGAILYFREVLLKEAFH